MNLDQVSLDDKYARADGELYLTGTQTLVKVAMLQGICDRQAERLDSWHNPMSRLQSFDQTDCNAGSNSLEIIRRLCNAVDSGMPAQWVRISRWLTPNSSQYGRSCS